MPNWAKIKLNELRLKWWLRKLSDRTKGLDRDRITGNRAHYWKDKHEREGNKKAAAVNQRQIEELRPHIAAWERSVREAVFQVHKYRTALEHEKPPPSPPAGIPPTGEGWCVPLTVWNPYRRKVANWIAREIQDAVTHHAAEGHVTSGVRTYEEQRGLYENFLHGGNIAARPGQSNHEGWNYQEKRGAVDWSDPPSLNAALHRKPEHKLIWAESVGFADEVHFSATGH